MAKKAFLITFAQTVRVICEGDEPTEDELIDACIKAQEAMAINGAFDTLDKCEEDTECPFGTFEKDK